MIDTIFFIFIFLFILDELEQMVVVDDGEGVVFDYLDYFFYGVFSVFDLLFVGGVEDFVLFVNAV